MLTITLSPEFATITRNGITRSYQRNSDSPSWNRLFSLLDNSSGDYIGYVNCESPFCRKAIYQYFPLGNRYSA